MKKLMIMALVVFGFGLHANAQEEKNAIGLRLGDSDGFGTEVSYQRYLDAKHRLEFDLGWRSSKNFDAYRLTGLYQWVWNIDGGFNWYVGAGGGVDGQVLVVHDMIGMTHEFNPRFLRRYLDLYSEMTTAFQQYNKDVKSSDFPNDKEQY